MHTLSLQKQFSSRSINDDGYELVDYEDHNVIIEYLANAHELRIACTVILLVSIQVACKLIPTTPSGIVIAPLYGIIAPTHDFTKYNRERAPLGLGVSLIYIDM